MNICRALIGSFRCGNSVKEETDLACVVLIKRVCNAMNYDHNFSHTHTQVMQRWVSFIAPTLKPAKWTPETNQKLFDTVNMLRNGSYIPWAQVMCTGPSN